MNIYLDTNVFIYLFENNEEYKNRFLDFYNKNLNANYFTSVFSLAEILVNVYKNERFELIDLYTKGIEKFVEEIIVIDESAAKKYAEIRAKFPKLSKPDVLHLACALEKCEIFLTNDERLWKTDLEGLNIIGF